MLSITLLILTGLVIAAVGCSTDTATSYNLRGPHHQANDKLLKTHAGSPSPPSLFLARKTNEIGIIQYRSDVEYTVSLRVSLLGRSILLNDKEKSIFELAALKFIATSGDFNTPLKSIGNIVFTDQKLTWSRLVGAGLQVLFQGDATVPYDITQGTVTREIQDLFELDAKAFQASFLQLLKNEESEDEPESTVVLSLEPIRVPLGIASAIAGCITLMFIIFLSMCYSKKTKADDDTKNLSKTSIVVEDEDKVANPIPPQSSFPVQQINNTRASFVDSDEDLTYDDDFDVNLNSDSQVKSEPKDVSALFECNQSAIVADIENNTDSDLSSDEEVGEIIEDHTHYEYSPIQKAGKGVLTLEELDSFDNEVRRCEC